MVSEATYRKAVKIVCLCITWYTVSSINNVVTKLILNDFPYPMTVTMVHLVSTSLYSLPVLFIWDIPSSARVPLRLWFKLILPLALGKVFSSVSSHISIWKVPVSYAHTVKATMPLFTVILSWLLMGEKITFRIFIALVPIVGGVAIATVTELSFNMIGLLSALSATLGFALQNILSKKCLKETGIHHLRLLYVLAVLAAVCMLPIWAIRDLTVLLSDTTVFQSIHAPKLVALLFIESFCGFMQNLVAFTVIALVTPLSYAVANASKRISIITVSLILLRNPVTPMNIFGMSLAVLGVLAYNKTKLDQKRAQEMLPTTTPHKSPLYTNGHLPNGVSLLNGQNSPFLEKRIFFGDDPIYTNGHAGHPMTPPAQHAAHVRTKFEDRAGNTIWMNV